MWVFFYFFHLQRTFYNKRAKQTKSLMLEKGLQGTNYLVSVPCVCILQAWAGFETNKKKPEDGEISLDSKDYLPRIHRV